VRLLNCLTIQHPRPETRTGFFQLNLFVDRLLMQGKNCEALRTGWFTQQAIMAQAMAQRESTSGVSLDEEAIKPVAVSEIVRSGSEVLEDCRRNDADDYVPGLVEFDTRNVGVLVCGSQLGNFL